MTGTGGVLPVVLVFLGGGLGAAGRFLLSGAVQRVAGGVFPWGTFSVNLLGCLAIGVLWGYSGRGTLGFPVSVFLFAGLLGGFTTFSAFGIETLALVHEGAWRLALIYVLLTNLLGLGMTWLGYSLTAGQPL